MKEAAKPLYIHGRTPVQVRLDGPALRIRQRCLNDRRFPLGRVSRVVVSGAVGLTSDVLLACADAGIVVCFLRPDGLPRGCWIGQPPNRSTFAEDWRHFLERPDGNELHRQWRIGVRQRAIRFCALCLGLGRRNVRELVRQMSRCAPNDPGFRAAKRGLYGLAHARSLEELAKLGLSDADASLRLVVPDLTAVIQWGLHPSLCDWQRRQAAMSMLDLATFFERNRSTVQFHLRDTLRHLACFLQEKM